MKALEKEVRKYYKYDYIPAEWTQPVLTANDSDPSFVVSDSKGSSYTYTSFNGVKGNDGWSPGNSAGPFSGLNSYCQIVTEPAINVTKINVTNRNPGDGYGQGVTSGSWQVSEDGENWILAATWSNSNTSVGATWSINLNYEGYFRYNRFYVYSGSSSISGNWITVSEIELIGTGLKQVTVEGTESDYDFYRDNVTTYNVKVEENRKYYQYYYEDETLASLPTYASAAEATAGKMGISFDPTNIYPMVAKSSNTYLPNSYGFDTIFTFEYGYILKTWSFSGWVIPNQLPSAGVSSVAGSNDKENWTNISNNGSNETLYKYYRLRLAGSEQWVYSYMGASYFNMNGIKRNRYSREVTPQLIERKYYKYQYNTWTQPVLSANGTIGGDSFACTQSSYYDSSLMAWHLFDSNDSTYYESNGASPYVIFYNPVEINMTQLDILWRSPSSQNSATSTISIYGSNDNSTWTTLASNITQTTLNNTTLSVDLSSNTEYYKYYKVQNTTPYQSVYWYAASFTITAVTKEIVEGTAQDYDFYEDIYNYDYYVDLGSLCKAFKSFEKGQYYGN